MTVLTNKMRTNALESIIRATELTQRKADLKVLTVSGAWRHVFDAIPKDFRNATKNMPKDWFMLQANLRMHRDANPLWQMEPERSSSYYTDVYIEPIPRPALLRIPEIVHDKVPKWLQPLVEIGKKIHEDESELRRTTSNALAAYTTVEKLVKDFPEFSRHVDVTTKAYPVAVNTKKTLDALSKAGFDTGAKA